MNFDGLLRLIDAHATYGPALRAAVEDGVPLVLNYHDHGGQGTYCVSICGKHTVAFELLTKGMDDLRELVHVEGFGKTLEDCRPMCEALAVALLAHYELERLPEVYLNGEPAPR